MPQPAFKQLSTIFLAALAWFALGLQLWLMMSNAASIGFTKTQTIINFLSYFTILSNLLVALTLTISLTGPGSFFSKVTVQSAIAVYIFIVGLVYNLVLRSIWEPKGWQLVVDNLLHVVVPVIYTIYWFLFTPRKVLMWKDIFPWLLFPFLYLCYSLIRGPIADWYPYPFLNTEKSGYGRVALNSFFVLVAFLVVGFGLIAINKRGKTK